MPAKVSSTILSIVTNMLVILALYGLLSLLGYSISLAGLLLVVTAIVAAGVRSIVKGTEYSIFAIIATLVEGLALLSLFTISTRPTSLGGMVTVSPSLVLDYVFILSITLYIVYTMIDDTLNTD